MDKIDWKWILYAVIGVFVLRLGGIITNFWLGLGIAGLVVIFALIQELPGYKKLITILFALWLLFCVALPPLIKHWTKKHPTLSESYAKLSEYQELMAALKINPKNGKKAEYGALKFCEDYEKIMTEWYNNILQYSLKNTLDTYPPDETSKFPWLSNQQRDLLNWPKHIKQEREECDKTVRLSKETDDQTEEQTKNIFTQISDLDAKTIFWIIVILIIAGNFAGAIFKDAGPRYKGAITNSVVIFVFALLIYHFIWGNLGQDLKEKMQGVQIPQISFSGENVKNDWERKIIRLPEENVFVNISEFIIQCYDYDFKVNPGDYKIRYTDGTEESHMKNVGNKVPSDVRRIQGREIFYIDRRKVEKGRGIAGCG